MSWLDRFDRFLVQAVATRSIAVVRAAVGLIAFWFLWPIARDALAGRTYLDRFHDPFFDAVPRLPASGFTVLVTVGAAAAIAMSVGLATRWSSAITALTVGYYLAASTTHLHNNRAYLFAVLVGVSLAPAGRSWSLDRQLAARRGSAPVEIGDEPIGESTSCDGASFGECNEPKERTHVGTDVPDSRTTLMPAWPLWLLRFTCALVYGASGFSKLIDPDWFGGTVTWGRVVTNEAMLRGSVLPEVIQDVLLDRSFHTFAAKLVVLTELFIAAGLWWRRTRWWAVATAVAFHIAIELSAEVETFSYLAIAVLVVWADPSLSGVTARMHRFRRVTA